MSQIQFCCQNNFNNTTTNVREYDYTFLLRENVLSYHSKVDMDQ